MLIILAAPTMAEKRISLFDMVFERSSRSHAELDDVNRFMLDLIFKFWGNFNKNVQYVQLKTKCKLLFLN